jgi:membrane protein YqaA with SNARE-associated domain
MQSLIGRYGYLIVFLGVVLEGVGLPLPGETVLITARALAHWGSLTLWETLVVGSFGAVMGGQAGYCVGRFGGRPFVLRWGRYIFITPERLGRAERFFEQHGGKAVFLARFITGLRVFGALVAGMSRMPLGKVHPLQRPRWCSLGDSGGRARLLPVDQHRSARALDRSDLAPPGSGAGSCRDLTLGVPQGHANQ